MNTNVVKLNIKNKSEQDKEQQQIALEKVKESSRHQEIHEKAIEEAYKTYTSYGWKPVRLYPGLKRPVGKNWQEKPTPELEAFAGFHNIGLAMGSRSSGLTDLDLDHPDVMAIAGKFLPHTGAKFGRYYGTGEQKLGHWLYRSNGEKTFQLVHPTEGMVIEVRSFGGQSMVPPSYIYDESTNKSQPFTDLVCWEGGAKAKIPSLESITEVPFDKLVSVARLIAVTALSFKQFKPGSYHNDCLAWCGLLAKAGYSREEVSTSIECIVEATGQSGLSDRLAAVEDTFIRLEQGELIIGISALRNSGWDTKHIDWVKRTLNLRSEVQLDDRPIVRVVPSKEIELYDATLKAVVETGKFYAVDRQLCIVTKEHDSAVITSLADQTLMGTCLSREIQFVQSILDKAAQVYKDQLVKAPPVVSKELSRFGTYLENVPVLSGISNIPLITQSGRIIDHQWGYEEELKIFFSCRFSLTKMHPDEALSILSEVFCDFPFALGSVSDVENCEAGVENCSLFGERYGRYLAAAISAILTAVVRHALDICPLYVITSSQWGDGKSVLSNLISAAVGMEGGSANSPLTRGGSDEEQEKQISSALSRGKRVIVYDNHDGEFRSPALVEVLTSSRPEFRVLGKSEVKAVSNRSMFMVNGVNTVLSGDLQTRAVMVRLARTDLSTNRKFKHVDVVDWAGKNSEKLVSASISLIEWALQKDDGIWKPNHRFKSWDKMVRRTIMLACGVDISPPVSEDKDRSIDPLDEVKHEFLEWIVALWESGLRDDKYKTCIRGVTIADSVAPDSIQEGWINTMSRRHNEPLDRKIGRCLSMVKDFPIKTKGKIYRVNQSSTDGRTVYRVEQI